MRKINTNNYGFRKSHSKPSFRGPKKNFASNRFKNKIDISGFIEQTRAKPSAPVEAIVIKNSFADFNLSEVIQSNLKFRGYNTPTQIQDQAIGAILEGKDLIGIANTGTGKTAAFILPMLEKVYKDKSQKVLIVTPTRELAIQIESEIKNFSGGMRIAYTTCVGGMPIYQQIRSLKNTNPSFVIGTPGRIKDLVKRGLIRLHNFSNVVLDEVDRMLDMGFIDDISFFLGELPADRQSLFFSATMPPRIKQLIETYSKDPVVVKTDTQQVAVNVEQGVIKATKETKFGKLKDLLNEVEASKVLIFSETKRDVDRLSNDLNNHGFRNESIHGDKRQGQRQKALDNFKSDRVKVLIATDVAARGLDIKGVTHVINYTVPQTFEDYIHRIGRTGRAEAKGIALTFVD